MCRVNRVGAPPPIASSAVSALVRGEGSAAQESPGPNDERAGVGHEVVDAPDILGSRPASFRSQRLFLHGGNVLGRDVNTVQH